MAAAKEPPMLQAHQVTETLCTNPVLRMPRIFTAATQREVLWMTAAGRNNVCAAVHGSVPQMEPRAEASPYGERSDPVILRLLLAGMRRPLIASARCRSAGRSMRKLAAATAVALLGFIIWIIFMANTGRRTMFFDLSQAIPYGDKLGHAVLYGGLALLINGASRFKTYGIGRVLIYIGTLVVILFVVIEELAQGLIPTRTLDALDLGADALGLVLASVASYCVAIRKQHRNHTAVL